MRTIGPARHHYLTLIILVGVLILSCREQAPSRQNHPKGFLALVGIGQDDPVWPVLRASAKRVHGDLGLSRLPLRTEAPRRSSVNMQRQLIQRLYGEGMVGLCVQVTDPKALLATLQSIAIRGVPVVTMMRPVRSDSPLSHAGLDDQAIGRALADALAQAIGESGTVAVLHADSVGTESTRRHTAFKARLASYRSIHSILEFDCHADPKSAERIIRDTMRRYPRLAGWAVMGDWPLRAGGDPSPLVPSTCRLVAVGPLPICRSRLADGSVWALIVPRYDQIAEQALTAAIAAVLASDGLPIHFDAPVQTVPAGDLEALDRQWRKWCSQPKDDND